MRGIQPKKELQVGNHYAPPKYNSLPRRVGIEDARVRGMYSLMTNGIGPSWDGFHKGDVESFKLVTNKKNNLKQQIKMSGKTKSTTF